MRRFVVLAVLATGCSWPDHQFRDPDDGAAGDLDSSAGDGEPDTYLEPEDSSAYPVPMTCPPQLEKAAPCDELREFPGVWEPDGDAREFCRDLTTGKQATPPRRFTVAEAARTSPSPAPARFKQRFEVRAGLSAYGVHVFVQVLGDPRVLVDRDDLVQGDAVEIFLRGHHDRTLTGALDADEGHHLVLTPPSTSAEGLGARYVDGKRGAPLADSDWHSRRVQGGFEIELHYPWTLLKNQAAPGTTMGFDVAIDLKDDPTAKGRELRVLMHVTPVASSPSCAALSVSPADPFCDDRTWCLAKAYVP